MRYKYGDTHNLRSFRKLYKGKRLNSTKIEDEYGVFYNKDRGEVELNWEETDKWTGDATTYVGTVYVDENMEIKDVAALTCERLLGDDARGSGYRAKRAEGHDYFLFDVKLSALLEKTDA